jgi:hypothetical protein
MCGVGANGPNGRVPIPRPTSFLNEFGEKETRKKEMIDGVSENRYLLVSPYTVNNQRDVLFKNYCVMEVV